MKLEHLNLDRQVVVVAEIGNNHEGSYTLAEELVCRAAEAGAGAVKFQTFRTEHYVSRSDPQRFRRLKSFELTESQFARLADLSRRQGLVFLSTPFDLPSIAALDPVVSAFKISSGDNTFYPLLEAVAATAKPILLSAGLADVHQLRRSKRLIERVWEDARVSQDLAVLHCVSGYPVPPEQANLAAIGHLKSELGCTIGYSDHTLGIQACACAVAAGARVIEKHFTLDKNLSQFRDHQLSADPAEMAALVRDVARVQSLLGTGHKVLQDCERPALVSARRSIVARRDLPGGTRLTRADITWVRPGGGLKPGQEHLLVGKSLKRTVNEGQMLTLADLRH